MNRRILHLAIPSIVSNITVPLLGLVDVTIVGHLGATAYIGAIAVGGLLFNILYWNFGFLRMGTSGLTSQAYGRKDKDAEIRVLVQAVSVGLFSALAMLILQYPIERLAFRLLDTSAEVEQYAVSYFRICIWGAPAVLAQYGFTGWFIGMQNSRYPMYIAIVMNVINIVCSSCFVFLFGMKVEGVALGTVVAQYSGVMMAWWLWFYNYKELRGRITFRGSLQLIAMRRFFAVNRDIFLRTLCLIGVTTFFTSTGARQGDVILAVNTLLMQLFTLFSYIMDGFAYAGEALSGRYVGACNLVQLKRAVKALFGWGVGLSLVFTLLYGIGGENFLGLLTNDTVVIETAGHYFYWVLAIPLAGFAAFLWDGILIGATATRFMLWAMLVASGSFFVIYYCFSGATNNHMLWLAFLVYLALRGIMQTLWSRKVFTLKYLQSLRS
ncbi:MULTISPECIES: MATE family efflux transporter [Butyricimonas]|jgi:MATE efflux family protein|uniref:MATE family multidrug resistance protein n=2 Tax=Butyricimonas faecihominis TaxID=1472416 RepID=A0A7W6MX14_9BACT|nr:MULTISPECIES: MATE family efflux transporter [Butyricimonas]MBS6689475.1 MATE family efflux transporter [Sanguibacteroides justesenii]KAB1507579.1 MATE family efflux transporter [Butyricimonas faecihominis]MBB4024542.1 MATE family multidrug resistance protein [Butyricimonas faecihominis]WOF08128.1 MATE family efflux transporter [Butyricimonas faecihominis]BEI55756.1 MATE family efflux transporter [Butyricimonas faecihominis]